MNIAMMTAQTNLIPQPSGLQQASLSDASFARALTLIRGRLGNCSNQWRRSFITSILYRRGAVCALTDFDGYLSHLERLPTDDPEWQQMLHELTVHDTWFFRHQPSLTCLHELLATHFSHLDSLMLWSVGCAYGEETWSLAITVDQALRSQNRLIPWQIVGSDLSTVCLRKARSGIYQRAQLKNIDQHVRNVYFQPVNDDQVKLAGDLAHHACFTRVDITDNTAPYQAAMHVVYCQNTLIYFGPAEKSRALDNLAAALVPGGILLVAPGEAHGWSHQSMRRIETENRNVALFQRTY